MQLPDLINGLFESSGALAAGLNVRQLYKDKVVKGFHVGSMLFFTSWGFWNLFYYPHLNQWFSFFGGAALCAVNCSWIALMYYYWRNAACKLT